jgi:hypothetical protein
MSTVKSNAPVVAANPSGVLIALFSSPSFWRTGKERRKPLDRQLSGCL